MLIFRLNYVHRDIKPDNILIDKTGHIKLADFGSCLKLDEYGKAHSNIAVGTPDYISPEILRAMEDGKGTYGKECDWWSLGICLFEMLFGEVPFYAESLVDTYSKIVNYEFAYPINIDEKEVSFAARDLISKLICAENSRLGSSGVGDIQRHPFFESIEWDTLNSKTPPYIPDFVNDSDTSNFEEISDQLNPKIISPPANFKHIPGQLPFVGYSYMWLSDFSVDHINYISDYSETNLARTCPNECDIQIENTVQVASLHHSKDLDNPLHHIPSDQYESFIKSNPQTPTECKLSNIMNNGSTSYHLDDLSLNQPQVISHSSDLKITNDVDVKFSGSYDKMDIATVENYSFIDTPSLNRIKKQYMIDGDIPPSILVEEFNSLCSKYDSVKYLYHRLLSVIKPMQQTINRYANNNLDQYPIDYSIKSSVLDNIEKENKLNTDTGNGEHFVPNSPCINQLAQLSNALDIEQEARKCLRHIADDLISDIEKIKKSSLNFGKIDGWHERRSVKNDNQRLHELELALDSEINAKQHISDELARSKEQQALSETQIHSLTKQAQELYSMIQKKQHEINKRDIEIKKLRSNLVGTSLSTSDKLQRKESLVEYLANDAGESLSNHNAVIIHEKTPEMCSDKFESLSSSSTISGTPPNSPNIESKSENLHLKNVKPPTHHHFLMTTLQEPIICDCCCSFMLGLIRQGVRCEHCNYQCHLHCVDSKDISTCPTSQKGKKLVFNAATGIGTIYQGWVKVPKPNGVRKGWLKQLMIICDYKIFFFELTIDKSHTFKLVQLIDICDEDFYISKVVDSEVIHAHPKLVPQIFKLSSCLRGCKDINPSILVLMQNENIRNTILTILTELRLFVKHNKLTKSPLYRPRELYDSAQLDLLRFINTACLIDTDSILIGCEDGLFLLDLPNHFSNRISDKKIFQLEYVESEKLIVYSAGRQKVLRMLEINSFEAADSNSIKILETKGSSIFLTGNLHQSTFIVVAVRKRLMFFEITKSTTSKYTKIKEINVQSSILSLNLFSSRICIGIHSGFIVLPIQGDGLPLYLVNTEDPTLAFLSSAPFEPLCSVELNIGQEYLLCFDLLAIYVDHIGKRSRQYEIKWLVAPSSIVYNSPYLLAYCETSVDVYDPNSGVWLQTLPLKRTQSISKDGTILVSYQSDPPKLVYLQCSSPTTYPSIQLKLPDTAVMNRRHTSQKVKVSKAMLDVWRSKSDKRHIEISPPTDFNHVQHVGSRDFFVLHPVPADADDPQNFSSKFRENSFNNSSGSNIHCGQIPIYTNEWDPFVISTNEQLETHQTPQIPLSFYSESVNSPTTITSVELDSPIFQVEVDRELIVSRNEHIF